MPDATGSTRPGPAGLLTRSGLRADLARLGLRAGDTLMVHAALRRVGRVLGGPDAVIGALLDATHPDGTVLAYTDWGAYDDVVLDADGRVHQEWRDHLPPFDPSRSRAARGNGALPELLRTWPEAHRSANPGASVTAVGARAAWLCADHPLDYGYGRGSPLAKLVAVDGSVLMLGAPLDTMTLLHHAEHLARLPDKRVVRYEISSAVEREVRWRLVEEFDTAQPVVAGLDDDYFATIVNDFLATGQGRRGTVGAAPSVLVNAKAITEFAVQWLETWCARRATSAHARHPGHASGTTDEFLVQKPS